MKTIFMITIFLFISISAFNQNKETALLLGSIQGQWQLDENGNVTYQRIVDSLKLSKTELYNKAMDYFVLNYGDANSVIQNKDSENGIIVGKGLFKNIHFGRGMWIAGTVSTWHILKIEVKDGKARITISLTLYNEALSSKSLSNIPIANEFPINQNESNKDLKNIMGVAFYKSHIKALETLDSVERALKGESTLKKDNNW